MFPKRFHLILWIVFSLQLKGKSSIVYVYNTPFGAVSKGKFRMNRSRTSISMISPCVNNSIIEHNLNNKQIKGFFFKLFEIVRLLTEPSG